MLRSLYIDNVSSMLAPCIIYELTDLKILFCRRITRYTFTHAQTMASARTMLLSTLQLCLLSFAMSRTAHNTIPKSPALHSSDEELDSSSRSLQGTGMKTTAIPNEHCCAYGYILAMHTVGLDFGAITPLVCLSLMYACSSRT